MVYITGDTHGVIGLQERVKKLKNILSYNDYLIVAGDFGVIWSRETLPQNIQQLEEIPFNILFVDGNHENFDILGTLPVEIWNGGKVHRVCKNVLHLMRGQVFAIEGKKFFTFGGANSIDKNWRVNHVSWWEEEMPSEFEIAEGKINLCRNYDIDYVITHAPLIEATDYLYRRSFLRSRFGKERYSPNNNKCGQILSSMFENITNVKCYYSGHMHLDEKIKCGGREYQLVFKNILQIC